MRRGVAQNMRFTAACRVGGGDLHARNDPNTIFPAEPQRRFAAGHRIVVGDRQRTDAAERRKRDNLLKRRGTVRIPRMAV